MKTIALQLDEQTIERAQQLAKAQRRSLESLLVEMIEQWVTVENGDSLLGMFADEPDVIDQVVESAMAARETHSLG
jgi:hypothetical protein